MANILALDQASYTTGYTILINGDICKVSHFTCKSNDLGERLEEIRETIKNLIITYKITEVVFEDIL